jgi:hypothetical protein
MELYELEPSEDDAPAPELAYALESEPAPEIEPEPGHEYDHDHIPRSLASSSLHKMNFRNVEIEKVIPLFTGILGSLVLCAFIASDTKLFIDPVRSGADPINVYSSQQEAVGSSFLEITEIVQDPVSEYYRDFEYQEWVVSFFSGICSSREISQAILGYSDEFHVPTALAFALCWEESRFNPRAVNRYNRDGSVDRGLFQLNNRSFPELDLSSYFDISINARYGISHLRHCLDFGGSEISALAMYNAGTGRVSTTGAPKVTLNYISRILENRTKIESRFHTMLMKEEENRMAERERAAAQALRDVKPSVPLQLNRTDTSPQ